MNDEQRFSERTTVWTRLSPAARARLGVAEVRIADGIANLMNRGEAPQPFSVRVEE